MTFFPGQIELDPGRADYKENLSRVMRYLKPGWEAIYLLTADGDDRIYVGRTKDPHRRIEQHRLSAVSERMYQWKQSVEGFDHRMKMFILVSTPSLHARCVEDCFVGRFRQMYGDKCINNRGLPRERSSGPRNHHYRNDISTSHIAHLYQADGYSRTDIARSLGINHSTVSRRLEKAGVAIRKKQNRRRKLSEERRLQISKQLTGRPVSPETRKKMSDARSAYWKEKKAA